MSETGWAGRLELRYRLDGGATLAHDRHHGPLRVLQPLYPEGRGICHHVLVHPPGGIVGGDRLELQVEVGEGAHALLTTPGATRFYRSGGPTAHQQVRLALAPGARCEWLPLETIAYPGCIAVNEVQLALGDGAEMLGWDLLALGLPASGAPFASGRYSQCLQWPGRWLERATLRAEDHTLLDGPLGLVGRRVMATLWCARAGTLATQEREALTDAARARIAASCGQRDGAEAPAPPGLQAGVTSPAPGLVLLRLLADGVEPALALLQAVRADWRRQLWGLPANPPRVWRT